MDEATSQLLASTFVEQYYTILCNFPENLKRFYDSDGSSTGHSTTLSDHVLLSRRWRHYQLRSVDVQVSGNGVFVLVIGVLTCDEGGGGGGGESKKLFSQSFFLAPVAGNNSQAFYVASDVYRFLDDQKLENPSSGSFLDSKQERGDDVASVDHPPNPSTTESFLESTQQVCETAPSPPKKSFLSVLKSNDVPFASHARPKPPPPAAPARNEAGKEESDLDRKISMLKKELRKQQGCPVASPARNNGKASDSMKKYHGPKAKRSIFVGNLNLNATTEDLHQEFSKFGKIVWDGIRLKADPWRRNCYAFVEYEDEVSKQRTLQASVTIGGRKVIIDQKKDRNSYENKS